MDESTSWEIIEWSEVREEAAKKMLASEATMIDEEKRGTFLDPSSIHVLISFQKSMKRRQHQCGKLFIRKTSKTSLKIELTLGKGGHVLMMTTVTMTKDLVFISRRKEYPELGGPNSPTLWNPNERVTVLEVGCGVGNSVWPLLELNPDKFFYAFDCSASAINIVKVIKSSLSSSSTSSSLSLTLLITNRVIHNTTQTRHVALSMTFAVDQ